MTLGEIATRPQLGGQAAPPATMSLDDPALAALELAAPPADGEGFLLTVRCVARECVAVNTPDGIRHAGLFDLTALSLVKE